MRQKIYTRTETPEEDQAKQDYYHDLNEQDDTDTPVCDDVWGEDR